MCCEGDRELGSMAARECYHCKQWIKAGEEHDCWTTTEAPLTQDLSDDLRDAWERLRETAIGFGDQRLYASTSRSCSRASPAISSCARNGPFLNSASFLVVP